MMNAEAVLNSQRMYPAKSQMQHATRREVRSVKTEELSDALAAERLTERFADLTWKTVAPITALSVTFFVGVLACAQFFAVCI